MIMRYNWVNIILYSTTKYYKTFGITFKKTPEVLRTKLKFKLPKKVDLSRCEDWRSVTLLSLTSKVFSQIILNIIMTAEENKVRKEQADFRKINIEQIRSSP